jgi:hypothetical protein
VLTGLRVLRDASLELMDTMPIRCPADLDTGCALTTRTWCASICSFRARLPVRPSVRQRRAQTAERSDFEELLHARSSQHVGWTP